ncbi:MAG: putative bifunctional diguanylate cyclase/phosphodiesterase [Actinomycetota bacterium]|jgi:diguanylate cyclase (GGDEF)-like protein
MGSVSSTRERTASAFGSGVVRVWCFIALIALASAAVWAYNLSHGGSLGTPGASALPWPVLAVVFYLAETYVVHLQFRKQAHTLSASEIGLTVGLFFVSPIGLLLAQVVGAGVAIVVHRRQKAIKLWFNLAEVSLACGLGLLVFRSLVDGGPMDPQAWATALLAAGVAHTSGVLLVTAVIAVAEGRLAAPQLTRTLAVSLVGALSACSLGLLVVDLVVNDPPALLLVALPLIACGVSFRAYMLQREQRERVEFLYESMRATQGAPEFGLAVGELLIAARRLLRAEYAEILLLSPIAGEPALRSTSGPEGEVLMRRETMTRGDDVALKVASDASRPVLLPRRRGPHPLDGVLVSRALNDAIVCTLKDEDRVFGLLLVGDRIGDVSTFAEEDLGLFETFAGHASVLLENGRLERSLAQVTELTEELHHQAYTDALTQLPNRLLFAERLGDTLDGGGRRTHAVLFLDLDRFKVVNDSWGHAAGDELLVQVAERIQGAVRPQDTPARLGGDEFAVLVRDTDAAGAMRAAKRLIDVINAPISLSSGHQATVHASVGVAVTGPDASTPEELLRNADLAMYTAKTEERACALFEPALHHRIRDRRSLALELEQAAKRGEFVAYYQPVVSLVDGTIQAFEALARWQHPERGLLEPADFLSVAEDTGLIFEVGASVRAQALQCAGRWPDAHPEAGNLGLWLNVAPGELTDERLVEDLALEMTRSRVDARRVTVEITESTVIRDESGALRAMHRLRDLGLQLSIDDFGTGYSSLSRLAEFPIELLKIPKPFVDRLIGEDADQTFVDAILRLAGSLGLVSTSEGVEHVGQARALRDLGCGLAQGFLFAEPMTGESVFRLLRGSAAHRGAPTLDAARAFARAYEPSALASS